MLASLVGKKNATLKQVQTLLVGNEFVSKCGNLSCLWNARWFKEKSRKKSRALI